MLTPEEDLRRNWASACDCDAFDGSDTFQDRMEAAGLIAMRTATREDVDACGFPEELGIIEGKLLWDLTDAGRAALAAEPRP